MKNVVVVLLCVAMFFAGRVNGGLPLRNDSARVTELEEENEKLKEKNAMLQVHYDTVAEMLQNSNNKVLELSDEVTKLKLQLLRLGVDVE